MTDAFARVALNHAIEIDGAESRQSLGVPLEQIMEIEIKTDTSILQDGKPTGLKVAQTGAKTIVYTPENKITGTRYKEHDMPNARYSLSHDNPGPIHGSTDLTMKFQTAGRGRFDADIRELLSTTSALIEA